ncbi:GNAT family N-acetyltransferase [Sphingomonas sp. LHG3406-1]|uniref:GNAT family N-acetyltransferase n=1 Tax=Sphingomonas sp. LHG3406-1 TaxID=2804617 RepID=UPI002604ABAA|nr:GNAT family N-acetyltransferase [Sphingomonas sp. LHG3406-1]
MFARTERLLLRPGWAEDAPALARAIADEAIVRNLATAPWPYGVNEAKTFLDKPQDPVLPTFLLFRRTDGAPELVGGAGFSRTPSGGVEIGYWIARAHWGNGYAEEAGRQLIEIARTIGLCRVEAGHFIDNPASGRVLEKLGFKATGRTAPRYSCARGGAQLCKLFTLDLGCAEEALAA